MAGNIVFVHLLFNFLYLVVDARHISKMKMQMFKCQLISHLHIRTKQANLKVNSLFQIVDCVQQICHVTILSPNGEKASSKFLEFQVTSASHQTI